MKQKRSGPIGMGVFYSEKCWDTHDVGEEVPILYLPENPATRIVKVGKPREEFLGQIFSIVLGVWAIGMGVYQI